MRNGHNRQPHKKMRVVSLLPSATEMLACVMEKAGPQSGIVRLLFARLFVR